MPVGEAGAVCWSISTRVRLRLLAESGPTFQSPEPAVGVLIYIWTAAGLYLRMRQVRPCIKSVLNRSRSSLLLQQVCDTPLWYSMELGRPSWPPPIRMPVLPVRAWSWLPVRVMSSIGALGIGPVRSLWPYVCSGWLDRIRRVQDRQQLLSV